ncbi:MAG TPA: radical SAM protein [Candidatus Mediterraneibacter stercoravium]|uniref:Radical SAM protein n=1 Tax=Candidatus Mediterraneibacter stercoravium TaxID=2838685 RepID=A0A9D2G6H5_9FIRM|nr:radical SAM protein [Candidatus Mediterraneibacter stercoravium]
MEPLEGATTVERMLLDQARRTYTPANGSIELLPLCNMNCDMCYVRLSREEMERQGKLRTADEWLEIGRQMKEAGVLFLLLTGGEPFLYPDFRRLYLELRKMGMIITINTNGTLIDEDLAVFLGKYKPRRVNITLYGTDEETYASLCHYPGGYEKTLRGIRLLREHGVDVKVGGSLTRANRADLDKLLDVEKELGIPVRVDTYMMPATRERDLPYNMQSRLDPEEAARARIHALKREMGPELFPQYVQQSVYRADHPEPVESAPGHMSCMAGQCSFTINWQGEMRPCVILSEPAASVFDMGFEAAWKYIVEETHKILLNAKCTSCHMRHLCRTCAASALLETGSYGGVPDYMCRYAEESLRILREEWENIQNGQDISDR